MNIGIIALVIFAAVAAIVLALGTVLRERKESQDLEDRLAALTGKKSASADVPSLLRESYDANLAGFWARLSSPAARIERLLEQADLNMSLQIFTGVSVALGVLGLAAAMVVRAPSPLIPFGAVMGILPFAFLVWKRKQRLSRFGAQLPDAMDLLARALRAGHSLPSGFQMVGHEMASPIATEFNRVYEEQNLGVPMEDALNGLGERVPNVDLGFFVTAVLIQRQTGGDLSEVLDKLGYIIRERFKIFGQVKALTAEGRLSGWTLIALPILVFVVLLQMNPKYVMMLFEEPLGRKMLTAAVIMQVVGALVIQKIVNIKV